MTQNSVQLVNLRTFNLTKNDVGDYGVLFFVNEFGKVKTLKELNLNDNRLTYECGKHLKKLLQVNTSIERLDLSSCPMGYFGHIRLFEGLA